MCPNDFIMLLSGKRAGGGGDGGGWGCVGGVQISHGTAAGSAASMSSC